jgi:RimJ/RimL family protein N-acetyltransferase/L-amino acid N-acyltransferase YncA
MTNTFIRTADPEQDFRQLADWFTILEDQPSTETALLEFYSKNRENCFSKVAEGDDGILTGFYWVDRSRVDPDLGILYLYVLPDNRRKGLGTRLYADMLPVMAENKLKTLRVRINSAWTDGMAFAKGRGFTERGHSIRMGLDLERFDDQPYDAIISRLQGEGFQFTSMAVLGNTLEAQQKLHKLNDATSSDTPGSEGEHAWPSFEDFQQSVCQANWYKPEGQMVVIDTHTGDWVAMSAITRMEGNDFAYNLHTGVQRNYRGRKLAQAVKMLALRFARDMLQTSRVETDHNSKNLPMIAIDIKLGYKELVSYYSMQKVLGG